MNSLKGSLLIAAPGLMDPNFARTVVFLAEHNHEGAFGLVLNRPAKVKVADLWGAISNETSSYEAQTFVGGPVQRNAVLLLHGYPDLVRETEPVIPGVYLGSEVELLGELIQRHSEGGSQSHIELPRFRVFCGYSGWGEGQLDAELRSGGWLTFPATIDLVFHTPPQRLWNLVLERLGGAYRFFALMPHNPEEN